MLAEPFEGREPDLTEENVQARIRGNVVMALSNKFGWLVLTTGNKSELSVGYATLYGDMAGGFAVLKDVYKGWVYRLVRWRNEQAATASSCRSRCSTARRRRSCAHEQRDDESLPPYDVLDAILEGYIEGDLDAGELVRRGLPAEDVERVIAHGRPAPSTSAARPRPASASPRAPSAATGGCRSRTATSPAWSPARAHAACAPSRPGRTAIVTREVAHRRSVVVGEVDVPDPGGAAAVPAAAPPRGRCPRTPGAGSWSGSTGPSRSPSGSTAE